MSFVNCRAYAFDPVRRTYAVHDAIRILGKRIVGFDATPASDGVARIDLGGATVVPAFADCHVHLTDTGYMLGVRDLRNVRGAVEFEQRVAALARGERFIVAGNYDESRWFDAASATAAPLDQHHSETLAMLVRIDGHSCLVNRKTFAHLAIEPGSAGIERDARGTPTGRLFLEANWIAQSRFFAQLPVVERRAAERRAADLAIREGAVHLHVQLVGFGGRDAYASEIEALRELAGLKIYPKICERDPALARSLGLPFVGGDVFLDGSIGSGTAAMSLPYCSAPFGNGAAQSGVLRFADADVTTYFAAAERLGISAGVHAIGDRAIEQCLTAWEQVLGNRASARNRHFIEHFEAATAEQIARCARLGIYLSMQPQFDADWGGAGGMYEARLGAERMRSMNALGSALRAGATVCGGDDSPVCRLSPLAGMAAACAHHTASERLSPLEALTMYTYDAARFGHAESHAGALAAGYDADLVMLDRDPLVDGSFSQAHVLQTWVDGACIYAA